MCTVSWIVHDQNYRLYFNRDEQRPRPRAEFPKVQRYDGIDLITPHDGPGGGSWIAVNEFGLTAFLLNHYAATSSGGSLGRSRSRGELPMIMAMQKSLIRAVGILEQMDLSPFQPFYLGMLTPLGEFRLFVWSGSGLEERDSGISMMTTSSFRPDEVEAYRKKRYLEICGERGCEWRRDNSLSFHRDLSHENRAFNPLMARDDAETHCISVIEVDPSRVSFSYYEDFLNTDHFSPNQVCSIERRDARL